MGRKPKIIPPILGTVDEIAEAIFAKDRTYIQVKKRSKQTQKQVDKTRKEEKMYRHFTLTYKRNTEGRCATVEVLLEYRGDKDLQREIDEIAMEFAEKFKRPCEHLSYRNVPTLPSGMQIGKPQIQVSHLPF